MGTDRIQSILWRLENGELDGVHPKVIVLLAGANNLGNAKPDGDGDALVADIKKGLESVIRRMRSKAPAAVIVVTGIFPRNDNRAVMPIINRINAELEKLTDGNKIRFLNINGKLADETGVLLPGMMNADKLHLALPGHQVWADALKPIFLKLLGPPSKEDHAPPATGDPSKKN